MLAELGLFALIVALCLCLLQAATLVPGAVGRFALPFVHPAASLTAWLVFLAFAALIGLRIDSDFSVLNVAEHSNRALPLLYKVAGTWGNHEGSMLLWLLVMTGMGALLASKARIAASVQALLAAGVLLFVLLTSNPFTRFFPPPADGKMLNPLLQDMALALHPPMLYLGYVGFSSVFSLAVAGLLARRFDRSWAQIAHPWIMFSWASLTVGIALGSWWAYRELGWGGFWFWDPVENASLLPWLAGTALVHANAVLRKRGVLAGWVCMLAIVTFGLSLLGTFLVRSGAITSVHSFASDPARGLYIIAYMALALGGAFTLYAARIQSIAPRSELNVSSREGMIVLNNLFLLTACATVMLGTLYPMFVELVGGQPVTVGAPYFNATFLPMMAIPLLFAGIAPFLPWKKAAFIPSAKQSWPGIVALMMTVCAVGLLVRKEMWLSMAGLGLGAFLLVACAQWFFTRNWRHAQQWPLFLAHAGAAVMVIGLTGAGLWAQQFERGVSPGDRVRMAGYEMHFAATEQIINANYVATRAVLEVSKQQKPVATLTPEYRHYAMRNVSTSEAAIYSTPAYDLYAVIGETNDEGKTALRLYYKPSISFLWLGALLVAAGGFLSAYLCVRKEKK